MTSTPTPPTDTGDATQENRMRKPILCLDFDGVIHSYASGWKGADVIPDPPVRGAESFIRRAAKEFDVQVYSSRSHQPGGIAAMSAWMREHMGDEVEALVGWPDHKPSAMVTIDDRAIMFTGQWPHIADLLAFQPWNKGPKLGATGEFPDGKLHRGDEGELRFDVARDVVSAMTSDSLPTAREVAERILRDVCELSGYTSPDDQPELLQFTTDELYTIIIDHIESDRARRAAPGDGGASKALAEYADRNAQMKWVSGSHHLATWAAENLPALIAHANALAAEVARLRSELAAAWAASDQGDDLARLAQASLSAMTAERDRYRTALAWALPLAETALEDHRIRRIEKGHNGDIRSVDEKGHQIVGLWQKEVDERAQARAALSEKPNADRI